VWKWLFCLLQKRWTQFVLVNALNIPFNQIPLTYNQWLLTIKYHICNICNRTLQVFDIQIDCDGESGKIGQCLSRSYWLITQTTVEKRWRHINWILIRYSSSYWGPSAYIASSQRRSNESATQKSNLHWPVGTPIISVSYNSNHETQATDLIFLQPFPKLTSVTHWEELF
jgi:hypothetical protein